MDTIQPLKSAHDRANARDAADLAERLFVAAWQGLQTEGMLPEEIVKWAADAAEDAFIAAQTFIRNRNAPSRWPR